jgi:hypothetical protein
MLQQHARHPFPRFVAIAFYALIPAVRATRLLRRWLSAEQCAQFDAMNFFDVVGCSTGKRYRIHYGQFANVREIDEAGNS